MRFREIIRRASMVSLRDPALEKAPRNAGERADAEHGPCAEDRLPEKIVCTRMPSLFYLPFLPFIRKSPVKGKLFAIIKRKLTISVTT